ncbi:MAG: GTP-binding protein [Coleofasciculus sp. Co-bin14]|nr:GTP-binding protein [Coleofasciculus sp. Co-bin14]
MSILSKKICLIGESGVGKNSLIRRFGEWHFSDEYLSTIGVNISRKTLELPGLKHQDKLYLQLLIWSVTGHSQFKAIAPSYLRGSSGALAVADVSRPETIEQLPEHIQLFLSINPKGFILIALNKSDLISEDQLTPLIQRVQLQRWEGVSGIYKTSAKTGLSVNEIFQQSAYRSLES